MKQSARSASVAFQKPDAKLRRNVLILRCRNQRPAPFRKQLFVERLSCKPQFREWARGAFDPFCLVRQGKGFKKEALFSIVQQSRIVLRKWS